LDDSEVVVVGCHRQHQPVLPVEGDLARIPVGGGGGGGGGGGAWMRGGGGLWCVGVGGYGHKGGCACACVSL